MEAHNSGTGAKYTKSRRPVKLVYCEEFQTKEEAMKREYAIKHMEKKEKEKMVLGMDMKKKEKEKMVPGMDMKKFLPGSCRDMAQWLRKPRNS